MYFVTQTASWPVRNSEWWSCLTPQHFIYSYQWWGPLQVYCIIKSWLSWTCCQTERLRSAVHSPHGEESYCCGGDADGDMSCCWLSYWNNCLGERLVTFYHSLYYQKNLKLKIYWGIILTVYYMGTAQSLSVWCFCIMFRWLILCYSKLVFVFLFLLPIPYLQTVLHCFCLRHTSCILLLFIMCSPCCIVDKNVQLYITCILWSSWLWHCYGLVHRYSW